MMYTILYFENGKQTWKKCSDLREAEKFGSEHTDDNSDYDLCVSLYEYDKLMSEIVRLEQKLEQIENICKYSLKRR